MEDEGTIKSILLDDYEGHKRLDQYLVEKLPELSRTTIKKMYEDGLITADVPLELKKMPPLGTLITIELPAIKSSELLSQDIPLNIVFEDEHLIIINKQAGLVVHPAPGNENGTLVNAILHHCGESLKGIGGERRPGIVHRLDKGTTGLMVVAKSQACHEGLVDLFSKHDIDRQYWAIAIGKTPLKSGRIETLFDRHPFNRLKMTTKIREGKKAITDYKLLENFSKNLMLLELTLHTGRTHQIRVHLSEILNTPIIGDQLYGNVTQQLKLIPEDIRPLLQDYEHPLLHARILGFVHPITKEKIRFEAEPDLVFSQVLTKLREAK